MIIYSTKLLEKYKLMQNIFDHALKLLGQSYKKIAVNIRFVSKNLIQKINLNTRKVDKPTDVLSFPLLANVFNKKISIKNFATDTDLGTKEILLGDIVICTSIAKAQANEYGHSVEREIYYLAVHGLLHLLGYDHMEENDKIFMRETEEKILKTFNISR
ncbi:MAG: rRNA maturation RNase YbeY [Clostridia bacterium]|jgi:probable rRNA maturation factor|nr:rRNA maturation RNase YbeY [Clostridia bacterium]MDD4276151.1 rRNA maturation RNase YbeY [Clostridia bacterium]